MKSASSKLFAFIFIISTISIANTLSLPNIVLEKIRNTTNGDLVIENEVYKFKMKIPKRKELDLALHFPLSSSWKAAKDIYHASFKPFFIKFNEKTVGKFNFEFRYNVANDKLVLWLELEKLENDEWVLVDEINTTLSLSETKKIHISINLKGTPLDLENSTISASAE